MNRVREHLRTCKRCFDTYQDSAICARLFDSGSPEFAPTKETVEIGISIPAGAHGTWEVRTAKRRAASVRKAAFGLTAACILALAAVAVWYVLAGRSGGRGPTTADLAPIRAAVETASRWGPLVLSGGERLLGSPGNVRRSGGVPVTDSLESALAGLSALYESGDQSNDTAYWLAAGKYVTGQIDIARDLTTEGRARYPDDSRIAVLEAIIAYADGDLDRSVRLLDSVVERNPDDPVANIDLAFVLAELGRIEEARAILHKVGHSAAGTPLASRAHSILSEIGYRPTDPARNPGDTSRSR